MIKFAAINEVTSGEVSNEGKKRQSWKEAQEADDYRKYQEALSEQQKGETENAEKLYLDLLQSPLLRVIVPTADEKLSLVQQSVLLKYLSLKNVASINERRGDVKRSLEYYLQALELDDTDVVMWYHCGSLALVLNDLNTARYALEKAVSVQPKHFLSVDKLIDVLYLIGDFGCCLALIDEVLEVDSTYEKGRYLKWHISKEITPHKKKPKFHALDNEPPSKNFSSLIERRVKRRKTEEESEKLKDITTTVEELNKTSWVDLGRLLLKIFKTVHLLNAPVTINLHQTQDSKDSSALINENSNSSTISVSTPIQSSQSQSGQSTQSQVTSPTDKMKTRSQAEKVVIEIETSMDSHSNLQGPLDILLNKILASLDSIAKKAEEMEKEDLQTSKPQLSNVTKTQITDEEKRLVTEFVNSKCKKRGIINILIDYLHTVCSLNGLWEKMLSDVTLRIQEALQPHMKLSRAYRYYLMLALLEFDYFEDNKATKRHLDQCCYYLDEVYQVLSENDEEDWIKWYFLKAKCEQAVGRTASAAEYYSECKSMLQAHLNTKLSSDVHTDKMEEDEVTHAEEEKHDRSKKKALSFYTRKYHAITVSGIDATLAELTSSQQEKAAFEAYDTGNFEKVVEILLPLLVQNQLSSSSVSSEQQKRSTRGGEKHKHGFGLLVVLEEAARSIGNKEVSLQCVEKLLSEYVDAELSDATMEIITSLVEKVRMDLQSEFKMSPTLLRNMMSTSIRLLKKLLIEGEKPSSKFTAQEKTLVLKSWLMFYHLLCVGSSEDTSLELLKHLHEYFGDRSICAEFNGEFLKLYTEVLLDMKYRHKSASDAESKERVEWNDRLQSELSQCMYCLCGGKGKLEPFESHEIPTVVDISSWDHKIARELLMFISEHRPSKSKHMQSQIATLCNMFQINLPSSESSAAASVSEPVQSVDGTLGVLPNGTVTDATVTTAPTSPPSAELMYLITAKKQLQDYLNEKIKEFSPEEPEMEKESSAAQDHIIQREIYFLSAVYRHEKIVKEFEEPDYRYNKTHYAANTPTDEKVSELCLLKKLFKRDLCYNPHRYESWLNLGLCYRLLADKMLDFGDAPLKQVPKLMSKSLDKLIMSVINKAVRCLITAREIDDSSCVIWEELGFLTYTKLRIEMQKTKLNEKPKSLAQLDFSQPVFDIDLNATPPQKQIPHRELMEISLEYFAEAQKIEPNYWVYPFMRGKLCEKLERDPREFLEFYRDAASLTQEDDPKYRLYASILKMVLNDRCCDYKLLNEYKFRSDAVVATEGENKEEGSENSVEISRESVIKDCEEALRHFVEKNKFFHKARYRLAYYLKNYQNNLTESKELISRLFTQNTKTRKKSMFIDLYRFNHEKGGKYLQECKKYTKLYIQILEESQDIKNLQVVQHWLKQGAEKLGDEIMHLTESALSSVLNTFHASIKEWIEKFTSNDGNDCQVEEHDFGKVLGKAYEIWNELRKDKAVVSYVNIVLEDAYRLFTKRFNTPVDMKEIKELCNAYWTASGKPRMNTKHVIEKSNKTSADAVGGVNKATQDESVNQSKQQTEVSDANSESVKMSEMSDGHDENVNHNKQQLEMSEVSDVQEEFVKSVIKDDEKENGENVKENDDVMKDSDDAMKDDMKDSEDMKESDDSKVTSDKEAEDGSDPLDVNSQEVLNVYTPSQLQEILKDAFTEKKTDDAVAMETDDVLLLPQ